MFMFCMYVPWVKNIQRTLFLTIWPLVLSYMYDPTRGIVFHQYWYPDFLLFGACSFGFEVRGRWVVLVLARTINILCWVVCLNHCRNKFYSQSLFVDFLILFVDKSTLSKGQLLSIEVKQNQRICQKMADKPFCLQRKLKYLKTLMCTSWWNFTSTLKYSEEEKLRLKGALPVKHLGNVIAVVLLEYFCDWCCL